MLGGISGYLVRETTDENPDRVAAVQQVTLAYLRSRLYPEDATWAELRSEWNNSANPPGQIIVK
jgi:hypothetical protein